MAHSWTIRFLEHRIADKRILRLIAKWLKVGITEDGLVTRCERGTPQGAVISPILANVYLHYVFDLWTHRWRRNATGDVIAIRYADDTIVGFQHEHEAKAFLHDLQERMRLPALLHAITQMGLVCHRAQDDQEDDVETAAGGQDGVAQENARLHRQDRSVVDPDASRAPELLRRFR